MADQTAEGAAPTAEQPAAPDFIGGFAPGPAPDPKPIPSRDAAPEPVTPEPEQPEKTEPAPEPEKLAEKPADPPKESPLAEVLRARREAQQAREKAEASAKAEAERAAKAEAEAAKLRGKDLMEDPVGFARSRGWSKEDQLLIAQTLLYDLAPERATPEIRGRLLDAREARERKAAEARRTEAEKAEQAKALEHQINTYVAGLDAAAKSFAPGSYPESEAWFDSDHGTYMQSLLATAQNLAATATAEGRVADLTPAAVAVVLEADIAARMARRDKKRVAVPQPAKPADKAAPAASGKAPAGSPMSTKGATGSQTPRPPAQTEAERVQRAIEAAFGGR